MGGGMGMKTGPGPGPMMGMGPGACDGEDCGPMMMMDEDED
jgi:hypothetical protein